jgi:L-ribulose-5-phosphate 4-epimerase
MSLEQLKQQVLEANLDLPHYKLVTFTWGNVSGIDRELGLVVIKPSGVNYDHMTLSDLVVLDLAGNRVEGDLRPSSDTATHLVLYRRYPELGGVVHTHSTHATAWAQARRGIPIQGTTQADYFHGDVPCTRLLSESEVQQDYEGLTGHLIVETLQQTPPLTMPGILVANHGPFSWGKDAQDAVHNAVVLEEVARMAWITHQLNPQATALPDYMLEKHYQRKHGQDAYYGQSTAKS